MTIFNTPTKEFDSVTTKEITSCVFVDSTFVCEKIFIDFKGYIWKFRKSDFGNSSRGFTDVKIMKLVWLEKKRFEIWKRFREFVFWNLFQIWVWRFQILFKKSWTLNTCFDWTILVDFSHDVVFTRKWISALTKVFWWWVNFGIVTFAKFKLDSNVTRNPFIKSKY